jgi:solute carrier family 25 carnitine/acylcarnitine transporter 20/29
MLANSDATQTSRASTSPFVQLREGSSAITGSSSAAGSEQAKLLAADFGAAWVSFVCSVAVAHPIDTLRVRWQTLQQRPSYTIRVDGVRSLYRGITGPLLFLGPLISVSFAINESIRDRIRDKGWLRRAGETAATYDRSRWLTPTTPMPHGNVTPAESFAAGFLAGLVVTIWMCPLNVIRTQQQNSGRQGVQPLSVRAVVDTLWRTEGVRGIYRSVGLDALTGGLGRGVYWLSYETLKQRLRDASGSHGANYYVDWAAAFMTAFVWLATIFPLDIVRTKLQADKMGVPITDRLYRGSVRECVRQTYRQFGLRGFYAGFSLSLARSLASSGTSLPLYDAFKPHFRRAMGVHSPASLAVHEEDGPTGRHHLGGMPVGEPCDLSV